MVRETTIPSTSRKEDIEQTNNLKIVSRHGVGFDSIDLKALRKKNIPLTVVGDVNSTSVSEHTIMLILAVFKRVLLADEAVRKSNWKYRDNYEPTELFAKNLLIIGFGRIGQSLIKRCLGFEMNVFVYDPFVSNEKIKWNDLRVYPFSEKTIKTFTTGFGNDLDEFIL